MSIFDYLILAGVGLLVFFTPFAFGGVEAWALGVTEGICFALVLVWLVRSYIFRRDSFPTFAQRDFRGLRWPYRPHSWRCCSFQLAPLPPRVIKVISPATYRLYQKSLPGWPRRIVYANPAYANPPGIRKLRPLWWCCRRWRRSGAEPRYRLRRQPSREEPPPSCARFKAAADGKPAAHRASDTGFLAAAVGDAASDARRLAEMRRLRRRCFSSLRFTVPARAMPARSGSSAARWC